MLEAELASEHSLPPEVQRLLGTYMGVRRYDMLEGDTPVLGDLPLGETSLASLDVTASAVLSQLRILPEETDDQGHLFPEGRLDQDLQQIDLRAHNSWRAALHDYIELYNHGNLPMDISGAWLRRRLR
jgi:hypothetical protein